MALVVDTGPLVAYLDVSDDDHPRCKLLIDGATEPRVIPAPVLVELDFVLRPRGGSEAFRGLLDDVALGAFSVVDLAAEDYPRIRRLHEQYSDLPIGFVDAAVMATVERLNEPNLVTLDHRHFTIMRPIHVGALELLPER